MVKADKEGGAASEKTHDDKSIVLEEAVRDLKKKPEFKDLSDEQLKTIVQTVVVEVREIMISSSFSGPLPPSSAYDQYENTHPGSAERILNMAVIN